MKRWVRTAVTSESAFSSCMSFMAAVKSSGVISGEVAWMRHT